MSPTRRSLLQQKAYRDGVRDGMRDRDKEPDKPLTLEDVGVMTTDEINADGSASRMRSRRTAGRATLRPGVRRSEPARSTGRDHREDQPAPPSHATRGGRGEQRKGPTQAGRAGLQGRTRQGLLLGYRGFR